MIYDEDDWEMPGHQRKALLQKYQIDTTIFDECQAMSHWVGSIQDDINHWEEIRIRELKRQEDELIKNIQQAIKTIKTFPNRPSRVKNKSYAKALSEYNEAIEFLKSEGYNIASIIGKGND